jgi:hypothetical protein
MGLVVTITFALCTWITFYALGGKSFDGILLALAIIVAGIGLNVTARRVRESVGE